MSAAASFEHLGNNPSDLRRTLENTVERLDGRVGGGVLFLCGTLARQIVDVATVVKELELDGPVLIATGAGVLTERGEHELMSACTGLIWQTGSCEAFTVDKDGDEPLSARLARATERAAGKRKAPVAMFASREALNPAELFDTSQALDVPAFGGGTVGKPGAAVVSDGRIVTSEIAGLAMRGAGRAVVRASPACQLLGSPQPVTATDGALVLTIDSKPALDVLRRQASDVAGQRPVVVAVDVGDATVARPRVMLRGIRGIHESRGGVMLADGIEVGTRVAFAVLDANAAASNLEATLREVGRDTHGGVPRFGIYVDCAGRGTQLYGESGVDITAIRRRFPDLPIAGVKSAFEIGPGPLGPTTHLYSGVFCLMYAPS